MCPPAEKRGDEGRTPSKWCSVPRHVPVSPQRKRAQAPSRSPSDPHGRPDRHPSTWSLKHTLALGARPLSGRGRF